MKIVRIFAGLVAALCLSACMWVPDRGQFFFDRGVVSEETRARLAPGACSRRDVLCTLGVPDWVSPSEDRMVYRVRVVRSYWWAYLVIMMPYIGWYDVRSHLFEFDASGQLVDYRITTEPDHDIGDGGILPLVILDDVNRIDFAGYFDGADPGR